jgi:hypothetical protein
MPSVKTKQKKQIKKTDSKKIDDSVSDIEKDVIAPKIKKGGAVEIEEVEEIVVHDDKLPADPLVEVNEIDAELEEIGLDDDELDPFNDKWEQ